MSEIPKPTFTPYQSLFYRCGINYPRCKEDCYWYEEEPNMGAHIPCCQNKGGNYIEPKDCENCEHYTRLGPSYDELLKAARAMHTWIFLHSGDESMIYKECGLSDEMNAFLGYSGSFTFAVPVDEGG